MPEPLIDTNILSELIKPQPDEHCKVWSRTQTLFYISAVTIEESLYGLYRKSYFRRMKILENFLLQFCVVLPVTESIARRAGEMRGNFSTIGRTRNQPDMLIAATAKEHGLILATRNARDFKDCGIAVINPFEIHNEKP